MFHPEDYSNQLEVLDEVIWIDEKKGIQYRFSVSEFRDNYYMGIRKWIQDFEGEWVPTKAGVTLPYNLETTSALFRAFCGILSKAEVLDEVFNRANQNNEAAE
jgi:hypothetical protein